MENRTSDRSAIRLETANPQAPGQPARAAVSLVSELSRTDEDKATMEMYAAMLPRTHILGGIKRRHLAIAGGFALLLMVFGLARHLPASSAAAPVGPGPVAAPPAAAPAPAPLPAPPAPTPVAVPTPPAPVPVLAAAAQEPQSAAQPLPKPEQATQPSIAAAESPNVDECRQAIRKRDIKLVNASCERALAADPGLAKPLLALAKAQFEKGKSAQAAVWARKAVQVNSAMADAYLIIGVAEQEAHRPAAAKTAYQRYLELAPRGPYAEDVRSSLKSL